MEERRIVELGVGDVDLVEGLWKEMVEHHRRADRRTLSGARRRDGLAAAARPVRRVARGAARGALPRPRRGRRGGAARLRLPAGRPVGADLEPRRDGSATWSRSRSPPRPAGLGIGTELIDHCRDRLRELGATLVDASPCVAANDGRDRALRARGLPPLLAQPDRPDPVDRRRPERVGGRDGSLNPELTELSLENAAPAPQRQVALLRRGRAPRLGRRDGLPAGAAGEDRARRGGRARRHRLRLPGRARAGARRSPTSPRRGSAGRSTRPASAPLPTWSTRSPRCCGRSPSPATGSSSTRPSTTPSSRSSRSSGCELAEVPLVDGELDVDGDRRGVPPRRRRADPLQPPQPDRHAADRRRSSGRSPPPPPPDGAWVLSDEIHCAADPARRPPRPLPQRLRGGARARHRPRLRLEGVQPRRPRLRPVVTASERAAGGGRGASPSPPPTPATSACSRPSPPTATGPPGSTT